MLTVMYLIAFYLFKSFTESKILTKTLLVSHSLSINNGYQPVLNATTIKLFEHLLVPKAERYNVIATL